MTAAFVPTVLDAATYSLMLALIVSGMAVAYGQARVLNLAHGDFVTAGAYGAVAGQALHLPYTAGLVLGFAVAAAIGVGVYFLFLRHIRGDLMMSLLATIGIGLVIRETIGWAFGPEPRNVSSPVSETITLLDTSYPALRFLIAGVALVTMAGLVLFITKSELGLKVRAAISNREVARAMGLPVTKLDHGMFGLGCGVAGLAGAAIAPLFSVDPDLGLQFLIVSLMAVILAGLHRLEANFTPVLASAVLVGATATVLAQLVDPVLALMITLSLIVVATVARPRGLFG